MGNPGRLCSGTPLPRAQEEGGPGGARISCHLHHQSLRVDSEKSIWFINTNTLGVSLGTANWMGVHRSQGRCLSPPVPSSVLLLAALGLDEAGLGGGARGANEMKSPPGKLSCSAVGCPRPAARETEACLPISGLRQADHVPLWATFFSRLDPIVPSTDGDVRNCGNSPDFGARSCPAGGWSSDHRQILPSPATARVSLFSTVKWGNDSPLKKLYLFFNYGCHIMLY